MYSTQKEVMLINYGFDVIGSVALKFSGNTFLGKKDK